MLKVIVNGSPEENHHEARGNENHNTKYYYLQRFIWQLPTALHEEFKTWAECMYAGTNDTLTLYGVMGEDYINTNKIFVKFMCAETEKTEEKPT